MYERTWLERFPTAVAAAADREDGQRLASLLNCNIDTSLINHVRGDVFREIYNFLESPWCEIAIQHFAVLKAISNQDYIEAYTSQNVLSQVFLRFFMTSTNWSLPVLYVIMKNLRKFAIKADEYSLKTQTDPTKTVSRKLEEAARTINKAFNYCINDRSSMEISRKWGTYYIIGLLFKTYFKLKSQALSKNVLRAVAVAELPPLSAFPKSHQVTFKYYMGVIYFLNEDYKKAEEELLFSYNQCLKSYTKNKELILTFLIPTLLVRGILPCEELLSVYPRLQILYSPLVKAIKTGNIKSYDEALYHGEKRLIERGTYLTVERARNVCMRTLLKKVFILKGKSTRIQIETFRHALHFTGIPVDIEEVECMLANMIYKGYIKGYISHEKLTLVLSATSAFPSLTSLS